MQTKWSMQGELYLDLPHKVMYSTDASAYSERPMGVAYPANAADIRNLVDAARKEGFTLIPRGAGTSIAGQVVGSGLVVDVSRHLNRILEINTKERWVRVEPGVVRDELNMALRKYGLFFSPETSTSNRCCVGGMTGNNSCGSHSVVYGSVRDHIHEATVILSDGSEMLMRSLTPEEVREKETLNSAEGKIYRGLRDLIGNAKARRVIRENYPDPNLKRRNTGYALDFPAFSSAYCESATEPLNLCKLLAGSEGTLGFITELKLGLSPLPPPCRGVICMHCHSLQEAFDANLVALRHSPMAVELIDDNILRLSKQNIAQRRNRNFVNGDPAALLVVEIADDSDESLARHASEIIADMKSHDLGYDYPLVKGAGIKSVWALRKAGLGLLAGMPGDSKPVSVIEDTAVSPEFLKDFHHELKKELDRLNLECVYYAHIGSGELHLRPILNLKDPADIKRFREVATVTAQTVRKFRGSISGEHGDGRLRGEFIRIVLGEESYDMTLATKRLFDPHGVFNSGKITDTPPMDTHLRATREAPCINTYFDFSSRQGWLCAIEQCNGSGDCRKAQAFGGVMCPSFRATRDESHTTRARANILRELLLHPASDRIFSQPEILEVLATCLGCKGCKAECPSNVDMTRHKGEYLQHHYDESGVPWRTNLIANLTTIQKLGMLAPTVYNALLNSKSTGTIIKRMMEFAPERTLPGIYRHTLRHWMRKKALRPNAWNGKTVYLFADEFSNYEDVATGIHFVELLITLGYKVMIPDHAESGRILFSKGLLKRGRKLAERNVRLLSGIISEETPLVGIEPSCILSFRDEYPDLVGAGLKDDAAILARHALLYDEFIAREIAAGRISSRDFKEEERNILLHGHCHQKALANVSATIEMLTLPKGYRVSEIPSGCCGMAGQFGYEKHHYELSMKIGEEVLFPAVRSSGEETIIAAPGTSCRHHIHHATGRRALHPIDILHGALKK